MVEQGLDDRTGTRVFYPLRAGVLVTETWFYANHFRYAVAELDGLRSGRGGSPGRRRSAMRGIGVETGFVLTVMVMVAVEAGPSWPLFALGALHLVVSGVLLAYSARRWPRPLNLVADYRGAPRLLHASSDPTEFRKICRATQRAIDHARQADADEGRRAA